MSGFHRSVLVVAIATALASVLVTGALAADDADDPNAPTGVVAESPTTGAGEEIVDADDASAPAITAEAPAESPRLDDGRAPDAKPAANPLPAAPVADALDDGRSPDARPGAIAATEPASGPLDDGR